MSSMTESVPFMPFPYKVAKPLIHGFIPVSSFLVKFFPSLDSELEEIGSKLESKDYLGGALVSFLTYFSVIFLLLGMWAFRLELLGDLGTRLLILLISFMFAFAIFFYTMLFPKWTSTKKKDELERNLLFATRHLMIQTNAGVPLFDAMVSISEEYGDPNFDYGGISREFKKIIKEVRSGRELTEALEDSARRNPSPYYRRVVWQLANSNKAGANIGTVLKDMVEFLSDEQRISIRNYGSQLNPLALFYMLTCVIAPTMGLVFLMIMSTFVDIPITEITFAVILVLLMVIQILFIGLIKSRRPKVAL